jgi:Fe2+ or Zn2+ uptake regulation protein
MPELPIKLLVCGFDGSDRRPMVHDMMSDAFPAPQHNHAPCLDDAVRSAREAFSRNQMSFTPLREKVFREIAGSHKAVGAYEVLHSLAKKGTRLTPISVYRIINTLLDLGVVRRFKSRNAYYVSCSEDPRSPRIVLHVRYVAELPTPMEQQSSEVYAVLLHTALSHHGARS